MKISVVSGGFDPLHSGHISYIESAKKLGDYLIVALNSDEWLIQKKGKAFMPFKERKIILESIESVDKVVSFDDSDGSCNEALQKIKRENSSAEIIFCNGGDRNKKNIPENEIDGIKFEFNVGCIKKQSSSSLIKNYHFGSEERVWGRFLNLFTDEQVKVKELIIEPKKGMSLQKHNKRSEIWLVSNGKCVVNFSKINPEKTSEILLEKHNYLHIEVGDWHQITNPYEEVCKIIEIQYGIETNEEDIIRHSYYKDE